MKYAEGGSVIINKWVVKGAVPMAGKGGVKKSKKNRYKVG